MGTLVPLEDVPPAARGLITPGTPAWQTYAAEAERKGGLPPGSLTGARFNLRLGTDPLSVFNGVAASLAANPQAAAPARTGAAAIPTEQEERTGRYTPPPQPPVNVDPSAGGGTFQVGPLDTGLHTPQWFDRTLSGLGKSFSDTVQGVGQLAGVVSPGQVAETRRLDAPLMNTGAGVTGYMGGTALQAIAPAGAVAEGAAAMRAAPALARVAPTLLRAATSAPAQSAVVGGGLGATQPVAPGDSRAANVGEGAVLGGGVSALGSGVRAMGSAAVAGNPALQALADTAANAGIRLRAGQVSNNPLTRLATTVADKLPGSGTSALLDAQHAQFNRALARTIGADTDNATQAFRDAHPNLTAAYDDLKARNNLQLEPWHVDALGDYADAYRPFAVSAPGQQNLRALQGWRTNIANATDENGVLTGEQYKAFRSELGDAANTADSSQFKIALKGYQRVLDNAFRSGLSPEDNALLTQTDRYWGNMKTLGQMAPKTPEGDFDFGKLAQVMSRNTKGNQPNVSKALYGQGDQTLPDLANIGVNFLNRGAEGSPAGPADWASRLGRAAVKPVGVAALGGGLYAMNRGEDEHPVLTSLGELALLGGAGALGGRAMNSQWMLNGASPLRTAGALLGAGAAPVSAGALGAFRANLPPDGSTQP